MNYQTFIVQFPEFATTDSNLVASMLAASALEIDPNIWGNLGDQGQAYLAAHKLATSPFGQNVRLVAKDGTTTYEREYRRLVLSVTSGYRVC